MATLSKGAAQSVLHGVPYDWYVGLRDDPGNRHLRMTYDDGVLEIMSPEFRHETSADRVGMIVRAVASSFGVACTGARCTTIRRGTAGTRRGKGKEPDNSFYTAHAPAVRGKPTIDLDVDPPPDLWVGVDNRGSSRSHLPLYAALGVPEVWRLRVRRRALWFGRLVGDDYVEIGQSLSFPMVTPALVLALLDRASESPDETAWDDWMRDWLKHTFKPAYEAGGHAILP
jgi:Uma2 family endonuclease